jgi:hypothetical protein
MTVYFNSLYLLKFIAWFFNAQFTTHYLSAIEAIFLLIKIIIIKIDRLLLKLN